MKKTNILAVAGFLVFVLSGPPSNVHSYALLGWSAYAHGTDTGMNGSMGMMKMMDLMHDQMDSNQTFDCNEATDMEMMEEGEEMMEKMMGHEDHERVEEAMEKDMQDHDSMHLMMGMWSSGCVGDETMSTLAARHGFSEQMGGLSKNPDSANWPSVFLGIIIGAIGGWAGSRLLKKKSINQV